MPGFIWRIYYCEQSVSSVLWETLTVIAYFLFVWKNICDWNTTILTVKSLVLYFTAIINAHAIEYRIWNSIIFNDFLHRIEQSLKSQGKKGHHRYLKNQLWIFNKKSWKYINEVRCITSMTLILTTSLSGEKYQCFKIHNKNIFSCC